MMQKRIFLGLLVLASSGCVTVSDGHTCAVAGIFSAGANCSHLISTATEELTLDEFLDYLEAQGDRNCVAVPGFNVCADDQSKGEKINLPKRGAAICMPSEDWNKMKTALEQACRELGSRCSYDIRLAIQKK